MDITFNKVDEFWEAEFEATADFNIHLERNKGGVFKVYLKTAGSEYALVDELDKVYTQYKGVVDYDFAGVVFPKMIKVVSASDPTLAVVTCPDGEVTIIKPTLMFTIEGVEYRFEDGMDWAQWVDSEYNTDGYYLNEAYLYNSDKRGYLADKDGNHLQALWTSPIADYQYTLNPNTPW